MAERRHKAIYLRDVGLYCTKLVELIEEVQPLLDTGTSEAEAKLDVAAGRAHTALLVLRGAAQRALHAPDETT